jgi:SAM-dependent methyltransferase
VRKVENADTRCPVCESAETFEFLHRGSVPVHQNLLLADPEVARSQARGTLAMHVCEHCGFAFNAAFVPELLTYNHEYDNTQTWSGAFNDYVDDVVDELVELQGVRNCRIVEVGCGKGGVLKKLIARGGETTIGLGFDPTYLGPETDLDGRLQFHRQCYDASTAQFQTDIVVCRHVIEHVPSPLALLRAIRQALASSRHARVFFETPCLEWILRNQVPWDFFYEHCSLFTTDSLTTTFEHAGFDVVSVKHVFAGQYLWLEGRVTDKQREVQYEAGDIAGLARLFAQQEQITVAKWRAGLRDYRASGAIAVWGAGAKGVTFCNLADPERELISCVIDVNPAKQGQYVAGTGHRIIGPEQVSIMDIATVLVLNPNYLGEITDELTRRAWPAALVNMMRL